MTDSPPICPCHAQPMMPNGVRKSGSKAWTCSVKRRMWTRSYRREHPEQFRAYRLKHYKPKSSRQMRKERYGLTHEEVLALFEASDGLCALCYERPATHIDHDHVTGKVRGAVCSGCNTGLGLMGDSVDGLHQAIEYLETADAV